MFTTAYVLASAVLWPWLTDAAVCPGDDTLARNAADRIADGKAFDSHYYWEKRYVNGETSGLGSYGELAIYKAHVINEIVQEKGVKTVYEHGCGDGNNLRYYSSIEMYTGGDVSKTAIEAREKEYEGQTNRNFVHLNGESIIRELRADLVLSLDVLYHLVDSEVFISYIEDLFHMADKHVLIYAGDFTRAQDGPHIRFREFTPYLSARFPCWILERSFRKPTHLKSAADFFLYSRI